MIGSEVRASTTPCPRDLVLVVLCLPAAALAWALPAGVFTRHQVDAVSAAYPLLVFGTWSVLGWHLLTTHPATLRVCLVVLAALGAVLGSLALGPAPVVATRSDPSGTVLASVEAVALAQDSRITVTRPGRVVSVHLDAVCTTDTSGVLNTATIAWTSRESFDLTLGDDPQPYVAFTVTGDHLEPDDSDLGWRAC